MNHGAPNGRNGFIDYCRLVAAAGIVWFHSEAPGDHIAYAALPFFLIMLGLPTRSSQSDRARRLLLLFVVWSAIYALLWMSVALVRGLDLFIWWRPWMVVGGTSIHLWFIPFAFLVATAAPMLRGRKVTVLLPVAAAATLAFLGETRAFPFYQWSVGIIPALIGIVHVQSRRHAILALIASYLVLELFRPSPDNAVILAGSAVAILAFSISIPATRLSAWCARLSLWVYLSHMAVMFFIEEAGIVGIPLALLTILGSLIAAVGIELLLQVLKPAAAPARGRSPPA